MCVLVFSTRVLDPCARPTCTTPKRTPAAGAGVEATSAAYGPASLSSTELPPRPRIRGAWSDEACARITLVSSNPTYQVFEHLFEPDTTVAPTSDTRQPRSARLARTRAAARAIRQARVLTQEPPVEEARFVPEPSADLLDDDHIDDFCRLHPRWSYDGTALVAQVEAPTFLHGIDDVAAIARVAEEMDHHPDIEIRWRNLTFRLSTHSAHGVTGLDIALAERIDAIVDAAP